MRVVALGIRCEGQEGGGQPRLAPGGACVPRAYPSPARGPSRNLHCHQKGGLRVWGSLEQGHLQREVGGQTDLA